MTVLKNKKCLILLTIIFVFPLSTYQYIQLEKDKTRTKVGGRMFRKALEEEVYLTKAKGLLTNRTSEQFG